jgi:enterochelin esterase-like enzyme
MPRRRAAFLLVSAALCAPLADLRSQPAPGPCGVKVTPLVVESRHVKRRMTELLVELDCVKPRPLLVLLHGRGGVPGDFLQLGLREGLISLGDRAPNVLLVDGGEHSYYHDRASGAWARYLLEEVIPMARRKLGAQNQPMAVGGISMGGFGALLLTIRHPGVFCATGGHSAALWPSGARTPAGAFDNAVDFQRNDLMVLASAHPRPFGKTRVWLDVGDRDPFVSANRSFVHRLQRARQEVVFHRWAGGHTGSYWGEHMPEYLRFYADALADCQTAARTRAAE